MTAAAEALADWDGQLLAVAEPVRRLAAARVDDPSAVDDVVQETLVRLLAARERLDDTALLPYALVTARNVISDSGRSAGRFQRHAHRVVDRSEPDRPEDLLIQQEERSAITAAIDALPDAQRRLLFAHEVEEVDTAVLAAAGGTTPGGVAAQLARARASLRVNYVLALRRAELPTLRCRPVLLALSAGDRRRQRRLGAGRHLLSCPTCASASAPLVNRRRSLAALAPWVWLPALLAGARRPVRPRSAALATVAAVLATVFALAVVALVSGPSDPKQVAPAAPRVAPAPADAADGARLTVRGAPLRLAADGSLTRYVGQPVRGQRVLVLDVPADEGFWVAGRTKTGSRGRIWVQLRSGGESRQAVRAGTRVSFTGTVVATEPNFAAAVGVRPEEGAALLQSQGAHISAAASAVTTDAVTTDPG